MRDMEIRGCGNIMGKEQHGHMDKVGYDMYCKLLNQAIKEIRGEKLETEKEVKIDVNIIVEYGARIPDVAFEIQNRVKKAVETMTGLTVTSVNVHVQGVNIPEEKDEPKNEEEEEK